MVSNPPPGDAPSAAMQREIEALEARSAGLNAELRSSRMTNLCLLVAAIAFVVVVATSFYRLGSGVVSEKNQQVLADLAQERLLKRSDDYMRQVGLLIDQTSPQLTAAFADRAKQDLPLYMKAIDEQRGPMLTRIEGRVRESLVKRQASALDDKQRILLEEFPKAADAAVQKAMIENLRIAADKVIKKHYLDQLHDQLVQLGDNLDQFPAAMPDTGKDAVPLEDQLTASLVELLSFKIAQPTAALSSVEKPSAAQPE